jgi:hypothetical protein
MEKGSVKDLTYGGLMELINNNKYYYKSSVGKDYSRFTDAGKQAVIEYIDLMAWKMIEAENADLEHRAKEQVMNALKGKE